LIFKVKQLALKYSIDT